MMDLVDGLGQGASGYYMHSKYLEVYIRWMEAGSTLVMEPMVGALVAVARCSLARIIDRIF